MSRMLPVSSGAKHACRILQIFCFAVLLMGTARQASAANFVVTTSGAYFMDAQWQTVLTGMGHTVNLQAPTVLNSNAFFAATDALIVSEGTGSYTATQINTIQAFIQSGKPVYLQSEYQSTYSSNQGFLQLVTALGSNFTWGATISGSLNVSVLGTYATTNLAVTALPYFWYGVTGTTTSPNVFPFLKDASNNNLGWAVCPNNSAYGKLITTTDQDWVQSPSTQQTALMKNIVTHMLAPQGSLCNNGPSLRGPANVVTGIQLWLKGDSVNATTANPANGAAVTTWKDVSGNANNATVLAGQGTPVMNSAQINGKDVVKFTRASAAAGTVYNVPNVDIRATTMPKTTIFTVYRQGTKGANELHGIWGNDNGNWDRFFMPTGDLVLGGTNNGLVSVGAPTNFVQVNNAGVVGQTKLLTAVYDNGVANGSTIYFNALPVQTVTDNTDPVAAQSTLRIGWDGDDDPYNGDIAEMIVYNRKLTDCEIKAVNRYLGYKYGVTFTTATISPAPDAFICTGGSTTLTGASVTSGASFTWLQNGSLIAGANSSTYNATTGGNYQVIASAGGCSDTSAITTVNEAYPTIYVDSSVAVSGTGASWGSPKKTVWEALRTANNTPTTCAVNIFVKKGTYYPMTSATTMATSRDSSLRITRNNIKLYGGFFGSEGSPAGRTNITGNATILSGDIGVANDSTDNVYHVMTVVGTSSSTIDTNTVVDGFTITRGQADGGGNFYVGTSFANQIDGGGIHLTGSVNGHSSPKVENCIFTKNFALYGAGLYAAAHQGGTVTPVVRNCTFNLNNATNGGGGYLAYGDGANPFVGGLVTGCTFSNNKGGGAGGAVYMACNAASGKLRPTVNNSTFTGNTSNNYGGGLYLAGNDSALGVISNCTITGNTATNFGAGMDIDGTTGITVSDCNISNNTGNYVGGGINYLNAGGTVTNCTFSGNTELSGTNATWGGGIACVFSNKKRQLTISNSTFNDNKVWYLGGGIYVQDSVALTITNCTSNRNATQTAGGFLHYSPPGNCPLVITGSTFNTDSARTAYGGAVRLTGPSPATFTNNKFLNSYGKVVGIFDVTGGPATTFTNCLFSGGKTEELGGVMNLDNGTATFTNSVFVNNATTTGNNAGGGVIHVTNGTTATFNDCTLYNNTTASTSNPNGNAITLDGSSTLNVNNTIIWSNAAQQISGTGTANYNYSNIKGITATATSISAYPQFTNPTNAIGADNIWGTADDGLHLNALISPSVNTGSNALVPGGITTDYAGAARIQNTTVDMGAYESAAAICPALTRVYVDSSLAYSGDGSSWSLAYKTVWEALKVANFCPAVNEIWVRKGTYYPMNNVTVPASSRDSSLRILRNGIKIYGGFNGTELTLAARTNITGNPTILSGDIGVANDSTDNAYHVMTIVSSTGILIDTTTIVDGFTITRGRNNAGASSLGAINGTAIATSDGGGILNAGNGAGLNCSPLIQNCIFTRNAGVFGAGVYDAAYNGGTSNPYYRFCTFTVNNATGGGAAMSNYGNVVSPNVSNCTFSYNRAPNNGAVDNNGNGGVSNTVFNSCTFIGNAATNGNAGAISFSGGSSTPSVINSSFTGNTATGAGGSINLNNAALTVSGSSFSLNKSNTGAGVECNSATLNISNSTFSTDSVLFAGAALRNNNSTINATDCKFLNNYGVTVGAVDNGSGTSTFLRCVFDANRAGGIGGALNNYNGSTAIFTNCVLTGNTTDNTGAGGGAVHAHSTSITTFNNSTLYNNASTGTPGGNALSLDAGAIANLNNTIVWGTAATQVVNAGTLNNAYSDIRGIAATGTNISADPQFINPSNPIGADGIWATTDDGLRMTPCSPAINGGSNALVPAGVTTDITGAARIQNTTVDMGAYEMPYASTGLPSTTIAMSPVNPVCAATSVTFTATTIAPGASPSYQWYKNNVAVAGATTATYTAASWVNGDVVTVVHTNNDCSLKDTAASITIVVTPVVGSPGTITGNATPCSGTSQVYSIPAVANATTYTWTFPTGWTVTAGAGTASITVTPNNTAGTITVTAANACSTSTPATKAVTPIISPAQPGTITGATATCSTISQTYSIAAVTNATTYTWTVPTGWVITAGQGTTSLTVTPSAGSGNITVTAGNGCATSSAATLAVTSTATPATPGAITGTTPVCAGSSQTYSITAVTNATAYNWTTPTGWSGTATTATPSETVLVGTAGGNVTVTASNYCGTSAAATLAVVVNANLTPSVSITNNSTANTICSGNSVTFTATPVNGGTAPTYQWKKNGINVTGTGATYTDAGLVNGDAISVVLTSNSPCVTTATATSATTIITVNSIPVAPATLTGASTICGGTTNTYTASPVGNATDYAWTAPTGWTSTPSTTTSFTTTANNSSGTITVSAHNSCGFSPITSLAVAVTAPLTPSVTIAANPGTAVCAGSSVTFTATPTNGGTTPAYQWKVNGTNVATGATYTTSTLANGDVVTAVLTTSLPCYTALTATSNALTMQVTSIPAQPGAISGATALCNGVAQQYSVTAVAGATNYTWTLPAGWSGSNVGPSILATPNGSGGTITVTANNQCGPSSPASLAVNVTSIPAQPGAISGPVTPCANTTQTYSVPAVSGATTYNWTLPAGWSGASSTATITVTTGAGAGTISVTAANGCGPSTAQTLAVAPISIPAAPATITGNATPCSGSAQVYSITAVAGATSYTWTGPSGWTGASTTASITYTTTATGGTVQVRANGVCGSSAFTSLSVNPILTLTPSVTVSTPSTTICQNAGATFTATPTGGGASPSYQWKKNGTNVGTNSPFYTDLYLVNGDVITVVLTSNAPCVTSTTATAAATTITVTPTAIPGISINTVPPIILCAGTPLIFSTTTTGGGTNPTYQWYKNGAPIPGVTTPTYNGTGFANGDTISVLLTSNAVCRLMDTIRSNKVGLTVQPNLTPTVLVTASPGTTVAMGTVVTFTATITDGGTAPAYQWYKNGTAIAFATNATYSTSGLHDGDLITVRLTSSAPCANPNILTSTPLRMNISTGVNTITGAGTGWTGTISLYPNPNTGHFTVSADWGSGHSGERVRLELVNALGQTVYGSELVPNAAKWSVDVWLNEGIANGLYMLRLKSAADGSGIVKPVMIQR